MWHHNHDRPSVTHLLGRLLRRRSPTAHAGTQAAAAAGNRLLRALTAITAHEHLDHLVIDGVYARSFFLLAPPESTDPGWLDRLVGLDCPCRIAIHLEGLDRQAERGRLLRRRRSFNAITHEQAKATGLMDVDAESAHAEAYQLARETQDPSQAILRWSLYLTVFAQTREQLDEHAARAYSVLASDLACLLGQALPHQLPVWQSTLPLCVDQARRAYRTLSPTVGNAFPFLTHNPGMTSGFPLGFTAVNHELVFLDPFDPSLPNALMNVVGSSGSGKTYLAQKLALHMLLRGGRVTVIDRSPGHYRCLAQAVGGCEVALGAQDPPTINLWDHEGTIGRAKLAFVADAHELLLADAPGQPLGALERSIRALYAHHQRISTQTGRRSVPLEREMVAWLEEEARLARQAGDEAEYARLHEMAVKLSPYVGEGRHASLVDRPTTVDSERGLLLFNLEGMDEGLHAFIMFLIIESVQRRVRAAGYASAGLETPLAPPTGTGRADRPRELVIVDEGYFLIASGGAAKRWLGRLARRGRHWGVFLLFITQQLSDLLDDPTAAALFNNASVQLLFRQDDQRTQDGRSASERLAAVLALSGEEVSRLAGLATLEGVSTQMLLLRKSKQATTAMRGVVEVVAHPLEHALFGSNVDEVAYRERMVAALGGDVWAAVKGCAAGLEVPETLDEEEAVLEPLDLAVERQVHPARSGGVHGQVAPPGYPVALVRPAQRVAGGDGPADPEDEDKRTGTPHNGRLPGGDPE